jgi:hypothetical protein
MRTATSGAQQLIRPGMARIIFNRIARYPASQAARTLQKKIIDAEATGGLGNLSFSAQELAILNPIVQSINEEEPVKKQQGGLVTPGNIDDNAYRAWLKKHGLRESPDYDTRGAFNAGLTPSENGHLSDEFKLPNHITFSTESRYAQKKDSPPPGRWEGSDQTGWTFYASPTNIKNAGSAEALQKYFRTYEKGVKLVLPSRYSKGGPAYSPAEQDLLRRYSSR